MTRESDVLQFCWWCIRFHCARRILFTFGSGLVFLPKFPVGWMNLLLSIHLGISNFEVWVGMSPVSSCKANSFPFVVIHRIDQRSRFLWRNILFALTVHHHIGGSGFCHQRAITRGCVSSSCRHSTNRNALSSPRENFLKWLRECREAHDIEETQKVIPLICPETSGPWEDCVLKSTWSTSLNWSTFCFLLTCWVWVSESRTAPVSWRLVWFGFNIVFGCL